MEWMPVEAAASSLGCSVRTVYRRIKAGELQTRHVGDRVEVAVEAPDVDGQIDRRVTDIAAASLTMRRMDADSVSAIRADFRDNLRAARRTALAVSVLLLTAVGGFAWGGYRWHLADVEHFQAMATLEMRNIALAASNQRQSALVVQIGTEARTGQENALQSFLEARQAVQDRDEARAERDTAISALRASRVADAVVAWLHGDHASPRLASRSTPGVVVERP